MSTKTAQIDQLLWKMIDIRKKVKTGEDVIKAVADPLQTYFSVAGANGRVAKVADTDLQKILKLSLEAREFANSFRAKGTGKWKDAYWLIEHLTEGSAGARQKNQQGIASLRDLKTKLNATTDVTKIADGLADAVMAILHIDIKNLANNLTSLSAANPMVWKDIKTINEATRKNLAAFIPNVDQAISYLGRM